MSRYYLMIPKTTFNKLNETYTNAAGEEAPNTKYDANLVQRLKRFSRIHSMDFDSIQPKNLAGTEALVEIDYSGDQYDISTDFLQNEIAAVTDQNGSLIPIAVEYLKLGKYKALGVISDFGIWKSPDEAKYPSISAVMKKRSKTWKQPEV